MAQANIAGAKSKYEGTGSNEVVLKASQELYALRVAELGEEHEHTIKSGKNYAIELQDATREADARELLTKLLATSKQVLGPHHKTTKEVEAALKDVLSVERRCILHQRLCCILNNIRLSTYTACEVLIIILILFVLRVSTCDSSVSYYP